MHGHINLAPGGGFASYKVLRCRSLLAPAVVGTLLILLFSAGTALADGGATMSVTTTVTRLFCGESMDVVYGYIPDPVDTPVLRGYSVRIVAATGLTFDQGDILVNSPLTGVDDTYIITANGDGDYTIDFTFLDTGAGLTDTADLFTVTMWDRGYSILLVPLGIDSGQFRTPENQAIVVDITDTSTVDVICGNPPPPTLDPEPPFTPGTTNTLSWSDESWDGAIEYNVLMSTDAGFETIVDESGWIPGLSYEFIDLIDGQQYFFKALSRNLILRISLDSNIENTVQDALPPTTSLDPLDPVQYLADFEVPFQADDVGSGFDQLELFYRYDGGSWTSYGSFSISPIDFTAVDGDGLYEFYVVGTDVAGNLEADPTGPQTSTTLDTSQPYGSFVINVGDEATNDPDVTLYISIVRAIEMRFSNDGASWPEGWVPLSDVHLWTIPSTEEIHTVHGEFRDGAMQVLQISDDIEFDITPPASVTSPIASPGHESTLLIWTNPVDPDFSRVEVWRGLYHDGSHISTYPSYSGSTVPTPPADRAAALASPEWELAGLSEIGANLFIDSVTERGMTATGTLLTVELPSGVDPATLDIRNITLDLRDVNNKPLEYDLQGKSGEVRPAAFFLGGAYPNPFNPSTTIRFSIPGKMPVRLEVYGMDGRRVAVLVDETLDVGPHEAVWLGRDDTGRQVASGVYFSKLLAGSQSQVRKMTLMK